MKNKTTSLRMIKYSCIICVLLYVGIGYIHASSDYFFKQISLEEGLSQSTVKCVTADKKGIIWIGTRFGLNRFDRDQIKSYYRDNNDIHSLPHNEISFILEDEKFNVWVGTEYGLARYNPEKDNFIRITHEGDPLITHAGLLINDGVLFWTNGDVYKYHYKDEKIEKLSIRKKDPLSVYVNDAILYDKEKGIVLLACRWNGVWWYNIYTSELEKATFTRELEITAVFVDSATNIWLSSYGKGVFCYDKNKEITCHLTAENRLSNEVVLDIEEYNNELWFATDGGGINIYNKETGLIRTIEHHPGELYSLPVNSFYSLYKDTENNMWAGSIRGGLIGMKEVSMKTYKDAPLNSVYGLSDKTVVGMYEDNKGILWLGTDGGGLNHFDPEKKTFKHYSVTGKAKVVSIIDFNDEELLLSYFSRGLFLFNKRSSSVREFPIVDDYKHKQMFRSGKSVYLARLDNETFYIFGDSVYLYNRSGKKLTTITSEEKDLALSSLHFVYGNNYVSYLRGAYDLFEVNIQQKTLRSFFRSYGSIGTFTATCRDNRGNFWIGTTTGLYMYNTINGTLEPKETNRFIGTVSLGFDHLNRLWVGTHNALYAYDTTDGRIVLFGESDGLSPNEYIDKAPLITRSGDIYMAGVMGLSHIQSDLPFIEEADLEINLLDIVLNGVSIISRLEKDNDHLSVPWNYSSLNAKVIVKEEDLLRKKIFRYYIKGKQEEMVEAPNHTINFHSLQTGHYEVWASCNKKNGDWSRPVRLFSLTVNPPWWQNSRFLLFSFVFILGMAGLVIWVIIKRNKNRMVLAMKDHENKINEEKIHFLINLSHELRTPLTLIYAPLKRLLKSSEVTVEEYRQQLSGIFKQTRRVKNLIDMVLDVRKMEVGYEKLDIRPYPLNTWLRTLVDDFSNEFSAQGMCLCYEPDERIGDIMFDAAKCEIVLSNLLMNAIKFSESGSTITVSTQLEHDMVRVSVSDEGIGLGTIDPQKLFVRFSQGEHGRKGSGIGLSYSRLLVEMHKGKMGAMDNQGKGATFYFELPVHNAGLKIASRPYLNELLLASEYSQNVDADLSMEKYSILAVEDEDELRNYLKQFFGEYFRQVYTAKDGSEALMMIHRQMPDIIVSDVMMPNMDGFELCGQVKNDIDISHIPVVLLTARNEQISSIQGYKMGADMYIAKPFDPDFLLSVLKNLLRNRELIKQRYKEYNQVVSPKEDTISNADEQFIKKLNLLITENIMNPDLDVNFASTYMAMSRATLYNKLKQLTDVSIGDYINKFRMAKAMELLANKDLTILEVSEQAGFSNQRYFSTVFKQAYGMTPSQYRQENFTN